jgi:hypothetical protein
VDGNGILLLRSIDTSDNPFPNRPLISRSPHALPLFDCVLVWKILIALNAT